MATTRSPTLKKDYIQYSKRLATWITAFWCLFRVAVLVVLLLRPSLASSMQGIIQGTDDVMMANIGFYAGNSIAEKGLVNYFKSRATRGAEDEEGADESNG